MDKDCIPVPRARNHCGFSQLVTFWSVFKMLMKYNSLKNITSYLFIGSTTFTANEITFPIFVNNCGRQCAGHSGNTLRVGQRAVAFLRFRIALRGMGDETAPRRPCGGWEAALRILYRNQEFVRSVMGLGFTARRPGWRFSSSEDVLSCPGTQPV